jgi:HKD family nuclease
LAITVRATIQAAGRDGLEAELRARLSDIAYRRFRFAMAFARWSGLHLIDVELQAFASAARHSIDGVIGIDLGGTTIEALTYLSELPNTRLRVVRSGMRNVVFHPKVYEFAGPTKWCLIIGSSNLTTGGLLANIESSFIVEGSASDANPGDALFAVFDQPPFTAEHVRLAGLTDRLTAALADPRQGFQH